LSAHAPAGHCSQCLLQFALDAGTSAAGEAPEIAFPAEKPGDNIGRYELLRQIGEGGCGMVYLARQETPLRREVALKVIKLGMDTRQVIARFEAERQALALMDHPGIARVLDAGATATGRPFFVMELVRGIPITRFCEEHNLTTRQRLELFIQVCRAVRHAHQKGVIHRDLKPANILVADNGGIPDPKIIDFGIAKATTGQTLTDKTIFTALEQFIGTPDYMSPEQALLGGPEVDTRTDIYSLGVLLYELLTGTTPLQLNRRSTSGYDEVRRIIREEEPPRPSARLGSLEAVSQSVRAKSRRAIPAKLRASLRGDLDWIVMKSLEKERERRYETADALSVDLERYLNSEPVMARPPGAWYRFQKTVRRNKLAFAAGAAVIAALASGLGFSLTQRTAALQALSQSEFLRGVQLLSGESRADEALTYLARSILADSRNEASLVCLANTLASRTWAYPRLTLENGSPLAFVEFSADGKRIVTVSEGGKVCVWGGVTGELLLNLAQSGPGVAGTPTNGITPPGSAHFSPDGKWLVGRDPGDPTIARVWDSQTGRSISSLNHGTEIVYSARFSPDGRRVVSCSADTARLWEAGTGATIGRPMVHSNVVWDAEFSPDGTKVVTASKDYTARAWDIQRGLIATLTNEMWVSSARFSPDGREVVTAAWDYNAVVWDAATGAPLRTNRHGANVVKTAQFSPDGKSVLSASYDMTAQVWDASSGRITAILRHNGGVRDAQFSPDGERVVTGSYDKTARIWLAQNGKAVTDPLRCGGAVFSVKFDPDGRRIATGSGDGVAQVWNIQNCPSVPMLFVHGASVRSARFSPDGKQVVTASTDGNVRLWNATTGVGLTAPLTNEVLWQSFSDEIPNNRGLKIPSATFSPDGQSVLSVSYSSNAYIWQPKTAKLATVLRGHSGMISGAQFSPDGARVLTVSMDHTARVWDSETGEQLVNFTNHRQWVLAGQFSPDGRRVVTGSADYTLRVWDVRTGQEQLEMRHDGGEVQSVQFSPDGNRILSAANDFTARVWDARTGRPIFAPLQCGNGLYMAEFSPDGTRIVTASSDHSARIWDGRTGLALTEPLLHDDVVLAAHFSPDGKRLATVSLDHTARVWDVKTGQPLTPPLRHRGTVFSVGFSPEGRRLVTASGDGTARCWDISPDPSEHPEWLILFVEAISGLTVNRAGAVVETTLNRSELITNVRHRLEKETGNSDWAVWARWFLADPATRTISPFSQVTVPEYVEDRIKENTTESLEDAQNLALGDTNLLARIERARQALKDAPKAAGAPAR